MCLMIYFLRLDQRQINYLTFYMDCTCRLVKEAYRSFPVNLLNFLQEPSKYWEKQHMLVSSRDEPLFKELVEVPPLLSLLTRSPF